MRDSDFYDHYQHDYWDEEPGEIAFNRWVDAGSDSKEEIEEAVRFFFYGPIHLVEAVLERERLTPEQCKAIFSSWRGDFADDGCDLGSKLVLIWESIRDSDDDVGYSPETFNQLATRLCEHHESSTLENLLFDPRIRFPVGIWENLFEAACKFYALDAEARQKVIATIAVAAWKKKDESGVKELLSWCQVYGYDSSLWSTLIENFRSQLELKLNTLLCKHIGVGTYYFGAADLIDFAAVTAIAGNLDALRPVLLHCTWLRQDDWTDLINVCMESLRSSPEIRANKPPTVEAVGDSVRTVKVGQPLTLLAAVKDDGVPKDRPRTNLFDGRTTVPDLRMLPPRQLTVGSSTGLWASLLKYRGPGNVTYEKDQVKSWEDTRAGANSQWAPRWVVPPAPADGKWSATVTFDEPGNYVMRWHASDGALTTDQDIKVTVTK